jgi:hypothetical protein
MPKWTDTSVEAEQVLREVSRRMPLERKWRQMGAIYETAQMLHQVGLQARGITQGEKPPTMTASNENLRVVQEVIAVLDQLGIVYALGGSWASSLLGKMRFTHDADLTAEPFPGREAVFCSSFGSDYYISLRAVQQAVRQRGSFNIIHTLNGFKVDLFIRKDRPFEKSLMNRRFAFTLPDSAGQTIQCISPEDLILVKLEWYRLGGEAAQQQLLDVRGVLEIQADRLDQAYLDRWAADLGVADLLARVRNESAP